MSVASDTATRYPKPFKSDSCVARIRPDGALLIEFANYPVEYRVAPADALGLGEWLIAMFGETR